MSKLKWEAPASTPRPAAGRNTGWRGRQLPDFEPGSGSENGSRPGSGGGTVYARLARFDEPPEGLGPRRIGPLQPIDRIRIEPAPIGVGERFAERALQLVAVDGDQDPERVAECLQGSRGFCLIVGECQLVGLDIEHVLAGLDRDAVIPARGLPVFEECLFVGSVGSLKRRKRGELALLETRLIRPAFLVSSISTMSLGLFPADTARSQIGTLGLETLEQLCRGAFRNRLRPLQTADLSAPCEGRP